MLLNSGAMTRILAFDTATDRGTVALVEAGEEGRVVACAEAAATVDSRHGETLLGLIEGAMLRAGCTPAELDLVVVGLGPGSFTGVRVGLATAKGLAVALGVPLVGISTLAVLAAAAGDRDVVAVIDARRGEVFAARYRGGLEVGEPLVGAPAEVARALAAQLDGAQPLLVGAAARGTELAGLGELAPPDFDAPSAAVLGQLGHQRWRSAGPSDLAGLTPRYLRGADVTTPKGPAQAG
jgi:tRNA threonylcarbamoyl adenosine modification protein YeaZ